MAEVPVFLSNGFNFASIMCFSCRYIFMSVMLLEKYLSAYFIPEVFI